MVHGQFAIKIISAAFYFANIIAKYIAIVSIKELDSLIV